MSADVETSAVILGKWNASGQLAVRVPGGLHADRLSTPTATPYARLQVKQGKPKMDCGGGRYIDYREVTITVWTVGKAVAGEIVDLADSLFAEQTLTGWPAGVSLVRSEYLESTIDEEDTVKAGDDYRAAKCRYMIWTDRIR